MIQFSDCHQIFRLLRFLKKNCMCIGVIKIVSQIILLCPNQVLLLRIKFSDKIMKILRRFRVSHLKQFSEGTPADSHVPHHHYESLSCQIIFRQLGEDWWHANISIFELDSYINAPPSTWIQIFRLLRFRKKFACASE